ncbi:RusA-like resolvase [Gordonia phage Getalong]|uniref:RusA-like resolvase n=3 Tax=Getalongvirus TaxID=2733156 RepID=A0A386KHQ2_9CAUD|nr:RusA-like Holliday junction resolvase [Gordonia phage Getalong]AYD83953.1 RusA-like resolvase [Gordonia phage Getalong]QCG77248.1 RusA-like resolvase [Gordonia phage Lutum]
MTVLTLDVPRPPMTANQQRAWHWRKQHQAKNHAETLVWAAARQARIPLLTAPQTVRVVWYAPDARRRDSDALGPMLKASLDALVKCGVLVDDDHRHVTSTSMAIALDRDRPRIELHIEEAQ